MANQADQKEIAEWQCPYCDQTRQSLPEIREHITETTSGEHRGVDGLKPTEDIVAYGPNGDVIERVEGVSTEPADPLEDYDKREIILNAWLAADEDPDREAVEAISGASQQYVSRLLGELDSGEIARDTYIEILDYGLREELEKRLKEYTPEPADNDTMTPEALTAKEVLEEASKKELILAAHDVAAEDASKKAIAEALDVSYEYVRQIYKDIEDRDPGDWQKLREKDVEGELPLQLKDSVRERLRQADINTEGDSEVDELQEAAFSEPAPSASGSVSVSEIARVRERVGLLYEQAQFTGDEEAEFVARKTIDWLDELLDQDE